MTTQHNTLTTVVPESEPIGAVSLYAADALSALKMVGNGYTGGRRPANLPKDIAPTKGFGQCDVELRAYFMTVHEDKINIAYGQQHHAKFLHAMRGQKSRREPTRTWIKWTAYKQNRDATAAAI
jgi:hypothetical protein